MSVQLHDTQTVVMCSNMGTKKTQTPRQ